ncbi:unnamed protein product [Schistocephalus solidus]|uniref:Uncharacterized protein n=1 Tax=Schistocephalus solidus TaxID=70667 RepID=A0A183SV50_SCHSO|nr:unnamed protein product [Schistocephalus solidus]
MQINTAIWEDLAQDRPTWRRSVKTVEAIYEATRIAAAKAIRAARKLQAPPFKPANTQALPTCTRCPRTFRAQIGLVGQLPTQCNKNPTTSTSASKNIPSATAAWNPTMTITTSTCDHFVEHRHLPPSPTPCSDHGGEHHSSHSR